MKPSTTPPAGKQGFVYSVFANVKAQEPPKRCQTVSFAGFAKLLTALPVYATKAEMPLIVASEFSGERTGKGAYRADNFITSVHGVCGDHDAGTMTMKDAAARLRKAGVEAAFYTSPSHLEVHPRWRVIAPFKAPGDRTAHRAAVEKLNHLLDGALTSESFAASQSYYIGQKSASPFITLYVKGRKRIDEIDCPRRPWRTALKGNGGSHVEEWTQSILGGEALHPSVLSFVGYLIAKGTPRDSIRPIVTPLIERAERDPERLQAMLGAELDRMIEGAFAKGYAARGLPVDILPVREEEEPPPAPEIVPFKLAVVGEMVQTEYTPPEEIITGEIRLTPGAHILAGKPKHGKSWLAMGLAVAAVTGEEYMGSRAPRPVHALYIAADDPSQARFARRVQAMAPQGKLDHLLHLTDIDNRAGSSLDLIAAVLRTDPAIRFVVIDTLSAFREKQRGDSPYQQEYDEVQAINKWAHEHNVCVLIVHHLRKGTVDTNDPFESISGTLGLQGGADGMLVLARKDLESELDESMTEKLAGLWGKSRDIEEYSVGIKLLEGRWRLYGKIGDVFSADTQREIINVLRGDPTRWWTSKEIHGAGDFSCKADGVRKACMRMAKRGAIESHRGALPGKSGGGGGYRCVP